MFRQIENIFQKRHIFGALWGGPLGYQKTQHQDLITAAKFHVPQNVGEEEEQEARSRGRADRGGRFCCKSHRPCVKVLVF